jgi:hypothetical protein
MIMDLENEDEIDTNLLLEETLIDITESKFKDSKALLSKKLEEV